MNVNELRVNSANFIGENVDVSGIFVLVGHDGYFVNSVDERDDKNIAIKVIVKDIKKITMDQVPPAGGSKYYYLDDAFINGTFVECQDGDFKYAIKDVTSLKIVKFGESFKAI